MHLFFCGLLFFVNFLLSNENPLDKNFLPEQYQDIFINGHVVQPGIRECESRYQVLKKFLTRYKRPITVLDLGASQGYFSFRIAHDFDATCVMIEGNYDDKWRISEQLLELCKLNTSLNNIVFLEKKIDIKDLERLSSCEHFDVVLAFNIIHHFGKDWQKAADATLSLGDNIFIETPPSNDSIAINNKNIAALENYLLEKQGKLLLEVPRHTNPQAKGKLLLFEKNKTSLSRKYWFLKENKYAGGGKYEIVGNYEEKKLIKTTKKYKKMICWEKGINLLTFHMLNGVFPLSDTIKKQMHTLKDKKPGKHPDFMPWNIIVQGNNLLLIDQDDQEFKDFNIEMEKSFSFSIRLLECQNEIETINWFKKYYPPFLNSIGIPFNNWSSYDFE